MSYEGTNEEATIKEVFIAIKDDEDFWEEIQEHIGQGFLHPGSKASFSIAKMAINIYGINHADSDWSDEAKKNIQIVSGLAEKIIEYYNEAEIPKIDFDAIARAEVEIEMAKRRGKTLTFYFCHNRSIFCYKVKDFHGNFLYDGTDLNDAVEEMNK